MQQQFESRWGNRPGLPIQRTMKSDDDHEIVSPELRRILAERKRMAP